MAPRITILDLAVVGLSLIAMAPGCGQISDARDGSCSLGGCSQSLRSQQAYALKGDSPAATGKDPTATAASCGAVDPGLASCCNKYHGINLYSTTVIKVMVENNINLDVALQNWNWNSNRNDNTGGNSTSNGGLNCCSGNCCNGACCSPGRPADPIVFDFSDNCGPFTPTGDFQCGELGFRPSTQCDAAAVAPATGSSGSGKRVWGTVLNDCYRSLGNTMESTLALEINVPSNWKTARLSFAAWDNVDYKEAHWDVRVGTTVVHRQTTALPPAKWNRVSADLTPWLGKRVPISVHFTASTHSPTLAGLYIDDVSITQ